MHLGGVVTAFTASHGPVEFIRNGTLGAMTLCELVVRSAQEVAQSNTPHLVNQVRRLRLAGFFVISDGDFGAGLCLFGPRDSFSSCQMNESRLNDDDGAKRMSASLSS